MWQCCRFAGVKKPRERFKKSTEIHKITKSTKKSMTGLNIHRFFPNCEIHEWSLKDFKNPQI